MSNWRLSICAYTVVCTAYLLNLVSLSSLAGPDPNLAKGACSSGPNESLVRFQSTRTCSPSPFTNTASIEPPRHSLSSASIQPTTSSVPSSDQPCSCFAACHARKALISCSTSGFPHVSSGAPPSSSSTALCVAVPRRHASFLFCSQLSRMARFASSSLACEWMSA